MSDPKQEIKIFILRPPSIAQTKTDINSLQELDSLFRFIGDRLNTSNVIVAGDFNAPDLKWNYPEPTNCSLNSERLLEIIDEHGLTQLVKESTRDDNILDLVLTNNVNILGYSRE